MGKEVRENHCARDFAPAVQANFTRDFQIITQKFTHLSMIFETLLSYEQRSATARAFLKLLKSLTCIAV